MKRLPAFSVILVFVVLIIIGAGVTPLLNVQYTPTQKRSEISIRYSWGNASAKLIEMEVTSKIEGLVSSIQGCSKVESHSAKGSGSVTAQFKKGADMEMIRFELATLLRQIYKKLPDGVSYPAISASSAGDEREAILTFTVNADLPTQDIETYVQDYIIKDLALVDGVNSVELSGATPYYRELAFDPQKLAAYKLSISDIESAVSNSLGEYDIIGSVDNIGILLKHNADIENLENIPLKNVEGRIIRVGDVVNVQYKEMAPKMYSRINGLNTINIDVYPEKYVNVLEVCAAVKGRMAALSENFPDRFSVIIPHDVSITLKDELSKIYVRTVLSLIILLLFVLAVSRSFKYLFVISFALLANILISFVFYVLFDMEIHLYSLAGITVSLGIVIDTAIVMVAHYGYYKNRTVFIAILAAQMTSIGALVVVFLLPESAKANLIDFVGVVIINLAVSLVISYLLIPALVDTMNLKEKKGLSGIKNRRGIIKFNTLYGKYIHYGKKYKWVTFVILVLGFGLPVDKLPTRMEYSKGCDSTLVELYNNTFGSDFYLNTLKKPVEIAFGGSWRLFNKSFSSSGYYSDPARPMLSISASLPDGCTISQLNEVVMSMENYLSQFEEIDIFRTNITSYKNASIQVYFNKDIEQSYLPLIIKSEVIAKATDFGGANWSVNGLDDQHFSNRIGGGYKSERIKLTGYNYDELYAYCQQSAQRLSNNGRVKDPIICGRVSWGSSLSQTEYFIDYDKEKLARYNLTLGDTYTSLKEQLYMNSLAQYYKNGARQTVDMVSANASSFDVWNLKNEYITIGDKQMRFSDIGQIAKRNTGNEIFRENQQYRLYIAYDYVGTHEQARRVRNREIRKLNEEILPIGFHAEEDENSYGGLRDGINYVLLLLLVVAVIYFICAVLFESLVLPLIIIGLIPVSIIGVFLIFAITGYRFDQGGFASLVMLAGIVVNAGIYILNEYRGQQKEKKYCGTNLYIRAFNHKIIPILLTVLSTILGLVPFLMDGASEVFWFAFALGTMGGLLFSLIALVLFMPIWTPIKKC